MGKSAQQDRRTTELTPRQEAFCREYVVDFNGTQAAMRAGYSERGADVQAARLLGDARVSARVAELAAKVAAKAELDAEWVIRSLRSVANRCMTAEQAVDSRGNPLGVYMFDSKGANRALELLGRHFAVFPRDVVTNLNLTLEDLRKLGPDELRALRDKLPA